MFKTCHLSGPSSGQGGGQCGRKYSHQIQRNKEDHGCKVEDLHLPPRDQGQGAGYTWNVLLRLSGDPDMLSNLPAPHL